MIPVFKAKIWVSPERPSWSKHNEFHKIIKHSNLFVNITNDPYSSIVLGE